MSTTSPSPSTLEETIRQSGEGWLLDWLAPPGEAIDHIQRTIRAVNKRARKRLGVKAPDISEKELIEEYRRNPQQVRAFFQALGGTPTPDMLLMVWRIIKGIEVKNVQIQYHRQESFRVEVILQSPSGDEDDETYTSTDIDDFSLFRHFGVLEIDGRPVFHGFYALRVR